nr:glycerate kinase [Arthrobacter sp. SF27]
MSILIAPDSFKGTYTAAEVAAAVASGVADAGGHAVQLPVADGGEGSFEALCRGLGARPVPVEVQNPWGEPGPRGNRNHGGRRHRRRRTGPGQRNHHDAQRRP